MKMEISSALAVVIVVVLILLLVSRVVKEHLVTNSPQLISTYELDWAYPSDTSFADYVKLPFMYFG